jgi:hypothetical protein
MWRTLTCLGLLAAATATYAQPPGQERRDERRTDRQETRAAMHGKIVRFDPAGGIIVVAEGVAPNAREVEYRMDSRVRIYGPDQAAITGGLNYEGFKPGAEIWFTPGDQDHVMREVRFYDPATAHMRGKVVRVDRERGIIVIRTGTGPDAKEIEYRVNNDTRYWDPDEGVINNGLNHQGFKVGVDVWYQSMPTNATTIRELRLYDPGARRPIRRR